MKLTNSIAFRIIFTSVALTFIYTVSLFTITYLKLSRGIMNEKITALEEEGESVIRDITNHEYNLKKSLEWLRQSIERIDGDSANFQSDLNALCNDGMHFFDLDEAAVFDLKGNLIAGTYDKNDSDKSVLQKGLGGSDTEDIFFKNSDIFAKGAYPIFRQRKVVGAIYASNKITSDEFVQSLADFTGMEFTIFDNYKRVYTSIPQMKGTEIEKKSIIDEAMKGNAFNGRATIAKKNFITTYFPLTNKKGEAITVLFLGSSLHDTQTLALEIFSSVLLLSSILGIVSMAILVGIMYFFLIRKLNFIRSSIKNLNSGEADLTYRLKIKGKDEFKEISEDINKFMEMLQKIVTTISMENQTLRGIGENLSSHSLETATATNQIMGNIQNVKKQAKEQANSVTDTSAVLDKANSNINTLNELIENQATEITESSAAIEEMLGNIGSVTESVKKMSQSFYVLSKTVNDSNAKIANVTQKANLMAEESQNLVQANNLISSVAAQTNLLAMNAAIEAAHAGEAGKGFAVVADEIRKLAETSSTQSKNIGGELKEILDIIHEVVTMSANTRDTFEQIVSQLQDSDTIMNQIDSAMNEQGAASKQILVALGDMKNQAIKVSESSKELFDGVGLVENGMQNVSEVSRSILNNMDEMAAGSKQISSSAENVSKIAQKNKSSIEVVEGMIAKFKI